MIIKFVLIGIIFTYLLVIVYFLQKRQKNKEINDILAQGMHEEKQMKTIFIEDDILRLLSLKDNMVKPVIIAIRIITLIVAIAATIMLGMAGLAIIAAVGVVFFMSNSTKELIKKSGINNIVMINSFVNNFVPHILAGQSSDQAMIEYINYSNSDEVDDWYTNRDDITYTIPRSIKEIVEIYDITRYNEEAGINDYVYILKEIQADIAQKNRYWNEYCAKEGEINPIVYSYYIGVPALVLLSTTITEGFWFTLPGLFCAIGILVLFALFKFLIYKIQKKSIETIF